MTDSTEQLTNLTNVVEGYLDKVKELMDSKVGNVDHALSAKTINGQSYEAFLESTTTDLRQHAAQKGNVHNETPADYNMLTNEQFAQEIEKRTRRGYFPVARWGDLTFLPAPVSGSFEGGAHIQEDGSSYNAEEFYNLCLEDDGTLVFIRNATNGRQRGAYYGFIRNALDKITRPTLTSQRYALPGCPQPVSLIYRGGDGAVVGKLDDTYNGGRYFLALMNGTLDCNQHRWVVLDDKWADILKWSNVIVKGNTCWIIETYKNNEAWGGNGIIYRYWKFVFGSQLNGTKVELEQLKVTDQWGLNSVNLNKFGPEGSYVISDSVFSEVNDSKTVLISAKKNGRNAFETGPSGHGLHRNYTDVRDGVFKTMFEMSIRSWPEKFSQDWWTIYFTFYFDSNTGKAWLEDNTWHGYEIALNDEQRPVLVGNLPQVHAAALVFLGSYDWNNPPCGYFYDNDTIYYSKSGWSYSTEICATRYADKRVMWDRLSAKDGFPNVTSNLRTGDIWPETASPIGPRCNGFTPTGNGWALTRARDRNGTNHNVLFRYDETGKNIPTRTYTDSEGKQRDSFKLNPDRYYLTDVPNAISECETMGLVSIVNGNDVKVRGSYWCGDRGYERQATELTDHLVGSNYRTVSKDRLKDRANELKQKLGYASSDQVYWEFVVFGFDNSTGYLFIATNKADQSRGGFYVARINITVNGSTYDINDIRDYQTVAEGNPENFRWLAQSNYNDPYSSINGKMYLYRVDADKGWVFCWNPTFHTEWNKGTPYAIRTSTVSGFLNDDGTFSFGVGMIPFNENGWTDRADPRGSVFPGRGIGISRCETIWTTNVFVPYIRNKAEALLRMDNEKPGQVVVANMEVAEGFTLYFTEKAPCVLNTTYYELESTSIDLRNIKKSPANSLFYVFVGIWSEGSDPVYRVISEDDITNAAINTDLLKVIRAGNGLYIGSVKCGLTQIEKIDVTKTTTLNGYTLSTKPAGNAIPVSTGNPDTPNSLSWV